MLLGVGQELGRALLRDAKPMIRLLAGRCVGIVTNRHRVCADALDEGLALAVLPQHLVRIDRWLQLLQLFQDSLVLESDLQVPVQLRLHVQGLPVDDEICTCATQVEALPLCTAHVGVVLIAAELRGLVGLLRLER